MCIRDRCKREADRQESVGNRAIKKSSAKKMHSQAEKQNKESWKTGQGELESRTRRAGKQDNLRKEARQEKNRSNRTASE